MKNAFLKIRRNRLDLRLKWLSRTFASPSTLRMFQSGSTQVVRKFVRNRIGDGRRLPESQARFDRKFRSLAVSLEQQIKTNRGKKPSFGQCAKIVALYVKDLLSRRDILGDSKRSRILRIAHVPLDRIVIDSMWKEFKEEIRSRGVLKKPKLATLGRGDYFLLQSILRDSARKARMPALDYDLLWAERDL